MQRFVTIGFLALAALGAACGTASVLQPGQSLRLTLAPGEPQVLSGSFRVQLNGVLADSRCPSDVQCITAGDAEVVLSFWDADNLHPTPGPSRLHTNVEPRSATYDVFEIRLDSLKPYPNTQRPTVAADYRAYVTVARK